MKKAVTRRKIGGSHAVKVATNNSVSSKTSVSEEARLSSNNPELVEVKSEQVVLEIEPVIEHNNKDIKNELENSLPKISNNMNDNFIEDKQKYEEEIKLLNKINSRLKIENKKLSTELSQQVHMSTIKQENSLLFAQLHKVQGELEQYYLINKKMKEGRSLSDADVVKSQVVKNPADQVKEDIPYQLGSLIIENSRNLNSIVQLPWLVYKKYLILENTKNSSQVDSVVNYPDTPEVAKVKQHLSYRLGNTLLQHTSSTLGWIKLPVALTREVLLFRRKAK